MALRGKIKSALTYPVLVLVFALFITYFLLTTIVPQFAGILTQLDAPLPPLTRALMAISDFLKHSTIFLFLIISVLVAAYRWYYKTPRGRYQVDAIKLKIPVFGSLLKKSAISSFARTFGLLISSGVNIIPKP